MLKEVVEAEETYDDEDVRTKKIEMMTKPLTMHTTDPRTDRSIERERPVRV